MTIKLTSIYVNDPIKAHQFYTEILGFQSLMYQPEARLAIVVSSEDPKGTALLLEPNDSPLAKDYQTALYKKNLPVLVLGVDDLQAEYERLSALGVQFNTAPSTGQWGTMVVFNDTCGNYVQIHQD